MLKIKVFDYDITPTVNDEIIVVFKAGEQDCEMAIPKTDLERMLWFANQKNNS